ncbi:hypothetical protein PN498_15775 [Oscillatoria sp. CS-180]|uniref:hypothetical protein n=1 Tax=Oscillatoria sp. CS-180 TaxID=3021720 RepID=UPI00232FD4C7|nr:hypothetical protein [Oscillatoria sp. CS-180]MDB9527458.1 hypothetical protein [Oscillatoria sp. CS-180]
MAGDLNLGTERSHPTNLLRWWHQYQAQMLNQETDFIRNGLLQEIIALRRRLEIDCQAQSQSEVDCEAHLAAINRFYALVEDFCDRLQSPYLQESLPLALQHVIQPWQDRLNLNLELPSVWSLEQVEHTRLLVLLVKTLLQQLLEAEELPQTLTLSLEEQGNVKCLTLSADYATLRPPSFWPSLRRSLSPFLQTFQLFTQGDCQEVVQPDSLSLKLSWAIPVLADS